MQALLLPLEQGLRLLPALPPLNPLPPLPAAPGVPLLLLMLLLLLGAWALLLLLVLLLLVAAFSVVLLQLLELLEQPVCFIIDLIRHHNLVHLSCYRNAQIGASKCCNMPHFLNQCMYEYKVFVEMRARVSIVQVYV